MKMKLRDLMNARKPPWTLEELSDKCGISVSTLSRLSSGSRRFNSDQLEKLAAALDCDPLDLLGGMPASQADRLMLELFHQLSPEDQQTIVDLTETISRRSAKK